MNPEPIKIEEPTLNDSPENRHERRKLAAQMKKLNKKRFGNNPAVKKAGKEIQKAIKEAMSQV